MMQSYTYLSHEGVKAIKRAFLGEYEITCVGWSEDAATLRKALEDYDHHGVLADMEQKLEHTGSDRLAFVLNSSQFDELVNALEFAASEGDYAPAGDLLAGIGATLGVEWI